MNDKNLNLTPLEIAKRNCDNVVEAMMAAEQEKVAPLVILPKGKGAEVVKKQLDPMYRVPQIYKMPKRETSG